MNTDIGVSTILKFIFLLPLWILLFLFGIVLLIAGQPFYGFLLLLLLSIKPFLYARNYTREVIKKEEARQEMIERQRAIKKVDSKQSSKPIWKRTGYKSYEAYIAEKERRIRKKEQDYLFAKAYRQRHKTTDFKRSLATVDNLLSLSPTEFEKYVKVNIFEKEGWQVSETKITGDGGIDLVLSKNGERSIAQCKRYKKTVGEPHLRDFYGTMMSEGVSRGFFITTGLFSLSALKFAEQKPIVLMDRRILAQKIKGGDTHE